MVQLSIAACMVFNTLVQTYRTVKGAAPTHRQAMVKPYNPSVSASGWLRTLLSFILVKTLFCPGSTVESLANVLSRLKAHLVTLNLEIPCQHLLMHFVDEARYGLNITPFQSIPVQTNRSRKYPPFPSLHLLLCTSPKYRTTYAHNYLSASFVKRQREPQHMC